MKCPCRVLVFYTGIQPYEYLGRVAIYEIEKRGIIKIGIDDFSPDCEYSDINDLDEQKKYLLKETFYAIRDLYHKHTHHVNNGNHDEVPDSLTLPSFHSDTVQAVKDIVQYYQEKIVEYNNYISEFIVKSQNQDSEDQYLINSTGLLRQAKGCFIYGSNLLELYPNAFSPEDYAYLTKMFINSTQAIQAFWDEINTRYNARISGNSKKLSLNSNLLALMIILFTILSLFSRVLFNDGSPQLIYMGLILIGLMGIIAYISIDERIHVR